MKTSCAIRLQRREISRLEKLKTLKLSRQGWHRELFLKLPEAEGDRQRDRFAGKFGTVIVFFDEGDDGL